MERLGYRPTFAARHIRTGRSQLFGFLTDQGTWRFTVRQDGKPWLQKPITLADPTGSYTVSPFVNHND